MVAPAPQPAVGSGVPETSGLLDFLTAAYNSKAYLLLFGAGLMLVVWLLRLVTAAKLVPDPLVAPLTVLTATLATMAAGLMANLSLGNAIETGLVTGFVTVGLWSGAGKLIRDLWRTYIRIGGWRGIIPAWRAWWKRRKTLAAAEGEEVVESSPSIQPGSSEPGSGPNDEPPPGGGL